MIVQILLIIIGFALLIKGADWLVNGASSLAKKHDISDLVIGLTIVSFGTSTPELVVNTIASFDNHPDIVFGNIVGSNNFNLFLILGIVGLIVPIKVQSSTVWKEIPISFLAALLLWWLANDFIFDGRNVFSRFDGAFLLLMFALFLYYVYKQMQRELPPGELLHHHDPSFKHKSNLLIWWLIIIGLAGLVLGGRLVVDNSVLIATNLGVSEKIIGLTIIAIGTSLPELVTSLVAALKKNSDIAIGNVVGSNIFNIFLILPVSSLIRPVHYNSSFNTDVYLLLAGTGLLFIAMFTLKKRKLDRIEASIMLGAYVLYTAYLIITEV